MKAKVYIGAIKYAVYIGRKIVEKTMNFFGFPARFFSIKDGALKDYKMYGNTVQGESPEVHPTPTAPVEIESVGVRTKNLFDKNNAVIGAYVNASGSIVTEPLYSYSDFIKVTPGKTYTVSGTDNSSSGSNKRVHGYDSAKQWKLQIKAQSASAKRDYAVTFTIPEGCEYVIFSGMATMDNLKELGGVQIEESSAVTPYEPYGYKVPVIVGGKNLFNKNNLTSGFINVNGRISAATTWEVSEFIKVLPNTNYTLSGVVQIYADIYHAFYDKDKNPISVIPVKVGITQLTSPANAAYIRLSIRIASHDKETVQLEEGSTATDYEPYSSTTTNIYLSEPLRKLGDYTDYIDFENQKVVRNIGYVKNVKYVGSKDSSGKLLQCIPPSNISIWLLPQEKYNMISTHYENASLYYARTGSGYYVVRYGGAIWIRDVDLLPVAVSQQDIEVGLCYQLETPTEESITLPAIALQQGNLSMDTDTKIKPSQLTITGDIDDVR